MDMMDPDGFGPLAGLQVHAASQAYRAGLLRDLVAFREVRVKILFAFKPGMGVDGAIQGQAKPHGRFHLFAVWQREGTRVSQGDITRLGVGFSGKAGRVIAKRFGERIELDVDLESDNGFPGGGAIRHEKGVSD